MAQSLRLSKWVTPSGAEYGKTATQQFLPNSLTCAPSALWLHMKHWSTSTKSHIKPSEVHWSLPECLAVSASLQKWRLPLFTESFLLKTMTDKHTSVFFFFKYLKVWHHKGHTLTSPLNRTSTQHPAERGGITLWWSCDLQSGPTGDLLLLEQRARGSARWILSPKLWSFFVRVYHKRFIFIHDHHPSLRPAEAAPVRLQEAAWTLRFCASVHCWATSFSSLTKIYFGFTFSGYFEYTLSVSTFILFIAFISCRDAEKVFYSNGSGNRSEHQTRVTKPGHVHPHGG